MFHNKFSSVISLLAASTMACSLLFSSGYSIGPLFLLLFSFGLFFVKQKIALSTDDKLLLAYGLGMFFFVYLDGWHMRELDRPSRFLLAIPVLLLLLNLLRG